MQEDFHYYATYCAACLAGYSHEESLDICYSAQFVDLCSKTLLSKIRAPLRAATTQLQLEMMDARTDIIGLQEITRIWSSFHFLPGDLYAQKEHRTKRYMNKYRLICRPNGDLLVETVRIAKGKSLQHTGIAMHVLADTWAHQYFAGTPSLVINNTDSDFFWEITEQNGEEVRRPIRFRHNPSAPDDPEKALYTNSLYQASENTIMNLGHGRAGHLPDYSYIRYAYLPAWGDYREIVKDNPQDYRRAFAQMVYAMKYLRGETDTFEKDTYDRTSVEPYEERLRSIIEKRQLLASDDWKRFGEELSGKEIPDFSIDRYQKEYTDAQEDKKNETFLGKFIEGALAQKGMVTHAIDQSGNRLAGASEVIRSEVVE
ncbi:MAG: hypothetical protein K5696_06950 [Lachnospiraceae bacterium]|nr:hypothetical protein [Lachnospiraceae bacterium]